MRYLKYEFNQYVVGVPFRTKQNTAIYLIITVFNQLIDAIVYKRHRWISYCGCVILGQTLKNVKITTILTIDITSKKKSMKPRFITLDEYMLLLLISIYGQ